MSKMKRSFLSWWKEEKGVATIALFILSLPLTIGVFGYGFDEVRADYLRGSLQNRADLAVQIALAGQTNTDSNGNLYIDPYAVEQEVNTLYQDNTDHYRSGSVLSCPADQLQGTLISSGKCGGEFSVIGTQEPLASYCSARSSGVNLNYGIDFKVKEQVNTVFMRILGISTITLPTVEAQAYLRPVCP